MRFINHYIVIIYKDESFLNKCFESTECKLRFCAFNKEFEALISGQMRYFWVDLRVPSQTGSQ